MKFTFDPPLIQGDVILKRLEELPTDATLTKLDVKILQQSEVTGHHHQFMPDAKVDLYQAAVDKQSEAKTITPNEGKFIVVREDSMLFHGRQFDLEPAKAKTGDHNAFVVPAGVYYVDIVREFDYDSMEEVRVVD